MVIEPPEEPKVRFARLANWLPAASVRFSVLPFSTTILVTAFAFVMPPVRLSVLPLLVTLNPLVPFTGEAIVIEPPVTPVMPW